MPEHDLKPTEARQGKQGRPVLWVLIGGLALGLIYIVSMMLFPAMEEMPPDTGVVETEQAPGGRDPAEGGQQPAPATSPPQGGNQ